MRARQIELPPEARALSTLSGVGYEDAFVVEVRSAQDRTAEEWARAILEGSPLSLRTGLVATWLVLGLKLGSPWSRRGVLGWPIRRSTPDVLLLGAGSRAGMPAQLLLKRDERTLLLATFVRHENRLARAVWARITPGHCRTVRHVLDQARYRVEAA
jgi:hypothetical protein